MSSLEPTTYWYLFKQDQSIGSFIVNSAISPYIFIEAESPLAANEFATQGLGIVFDGRAKRKDPPRSGQNRWSPVETHITYPITSFTPPLTDVHTHAAYLAELRTINSWTKPMVRIYHRNGTVESINRKEVK